MFRKLFLQNKNVVPWQESILMLLKHTSIMLIDISNALTNQYF